jgi:hypothetical protein
MPPRVAVCEELAVRVKPGRWWRAVEHDRRFVDRDLPEHGCAPCRLERHEPAVAVTEHALGAGLRLQPEEVLALLLDAVAQALGT